MRVTDEYISTVEFKYVEQGYDPDEVDDLLDEIIQDYAEYDATIAQLQADIERFKVENERLKVDLQGHSSPSASESERESSRVPAEEATLHSRMEGMNTTNFDILRRLNRLEKEVFGKQMSLSKE